MSTQKCRKCGLVNSFSDDACRRCGVDLEQTRPAYTGKQRDKGRPSSFLYTLLALTLVGGACYYLFNGFEHSYDQVKADELNRLAGQQKASPAPVISRVEEDKRRAEPYKNAIANSPNLAASQKHNEEVRQLMQPAK